MLHERHTISGDLAGDYKIHLASSIGNLQTSKRLEGILSIDAERGWHLLFSVTLNKETRSFDALSKAVRAYNNEHF